MLGGVDVVVDRLRRYFSEHCGLRPIIGVQDWTSERSIGVDQEGREFMPVAMPAPPSDHNWLSWIRFTISAIRRGFQIARQLRRQNVQVFNAHFPSPNLLTVVLAKRLGLWKGRFVASFHGSDIRAVRITKFSWQMIASAVDASTACSEALANDVRSIAGTAFEPLVVIHNGIDFEAFQTAASSAPPFVELGNRRMVLSVGGFVPRKGQDILIRAFSVICSSQPDIILALAGASDNGQWLKECRSLASKLGVSDRVLFFPDVPNAKVPSLMSQASCLALPSQSEGFPLVLIEAGSLGIPVVASSVGGIPELVSCPDLGILVEPGDVTALVTALERVLGSPEYALRLGQSLRKRIECDFSIETMSRTFLHTYHHSSVPTSERRGCVTIIRTLNYIKQRSAKYRHTFGTLHGMFAWWDMRQDYKRARGELYTVRVPALSRPITLRAGTSDREVFTQIFLDKELALSLDDEPRVIVDVGANIGLSTLFLAARYPSASFICIEPEEQNFLLLKENLSHITRIEAIQAALWHKPETLQISNPDAAAYAYRVGEQQGWAQTAGQLIRSVTMNQVLEMLPPGHNIDLLKIDIEGAERCLFSEGECEWLCKVRTLAIELHDRFEPGCRAALTAAINNRPHSWQRIGEYEVIRFSIHNGSS